VRPGLARGWGHAPGLTDLAIATTASTHGLVLLARNVRHFEFLPVEMADPLASSHALRGPRIGSALQVSRS
jgi:predicted nucleic acid-binding protein